MGECLIMRRGGETYKPAVLNAAYPQDVTKNVIKGNTTSATFSVQIAEAGNPAEYTYQWYKDGAAVSGATSSSYTISGLGSTVTHTVYCEVTNKGGTVQSRIATLKVTQQYTPVLNTSYPANVTKGIGESATFKVTIATAGVPASYTYQWYVNGNAVSGATSSSYTRSNLVKGSYTVYCKVTNSAGTVQSRTATLTVEKFYLYNKGDERTSVTGGWVVGNVPPPGWNYYESATLTKNDANMVLKGRLNTLYSSKKIDVTNYTTMVFKGSVNAWSTIRVKPTKDSQENGAYLDWSVGQTSRSVDISGLTGSHYVCLSIYGSDNSTITLTEVYME